MKKRIEKPAPSTTAPGKKQTVQSEPKAATDPRDPLLTLLRGTYAQRACDQVASR